MITQGSVVLVVDGGADGELGLAEGGVEELLLDELDDVGAGSGPVSVGAAPVAYPAAQDRTFDTYSIELL